MRNNRDRGSPVNPRPKNASPARYWQVGHPGGHVGCCDVGVMHKGWVTGPSDTQHSCPGPQHELPQQN